MSIYKPFTFFTLLLLICSSCSLENLLTKLDEHQTVTIQPSPLEYHHDSISFDAVIDFDHHPKLPSGVEYTLEFSYHTPQNDSLILGSIYLEDAITNKKRNISKSLTLPYLKKYQKGEVLVRSILAKKGQSVEGALTKLASGIITTHQLNRPLAIVHFLPHQHQPKIEYEEKSIQLYFTNNNSKVSKFTQSTPQVQLLEDHIARNELHDEIQIVGYHSPDIKEALSSEVAKKRADATANLIQQMYQRYEHSTIPQITSKAIYHDWSLFSRVLQESKNFNYAEKEDILKQIDGGIAYADIDKRFKKLPSYKRLTTYIYPLVRQSTVIVSVPKPQFTDAEIIVWCKKILAGQAPVDTLKAEEFAFAASQSPSLHDKKDIYETALKLYTRDALMQNNLGCVLLQLAKGEDKPHMKEQLIDDAIIQLKRAIQNNKKSPNHEPKINLASAQILKGNTTAALKTLLSVPTLTLPTPLHETLYGLKGYIYLYRADYISSIKALSSAGNTPDVLYNKALAYLLYASKNNQIKIFAKAQEGFDAAIKANPKDAWAFYGAAITAARLKNEELIAKYLKSAIQLNPELGEKASSDLEFIDYRQQDSFKSAFDQ